MFQPIRILIVEDEFAIALDLEFSLKKWGHEVIGIAKNVEEAEQLIKTGDPQLIILDIHLKGEKTGIDLAKIIVSDYEIPFIYLTAFGDKNTFQAASKTYPFAFLLKPFKEDELKRSIELAINQFEKNRLSFPDLTELLKELKADNIKLHNSSIFFAKEGSKVRKIEIDKILFISALDNYAEVHFTNDKIIIHESLSRLEIKLLSHDIIRVHRSYLVAISAIDKIEEDQIIIGQSNIPVSRSYKKALFNKLEWL